MTARDSLYPVAILLAASFLFTAVACENKARQIGPEGTGSLEGAVLDTAGTGVEGAAVRITQGRRGPSDDIRDDTTQSSSDGSYSFSNVAAGPWTLQVTPPDGFVRPDPIVVEVPVDGTLQQTVTIEPAPQ